MDIITALIKIQTELEAVEMTARRSNCEHMLIALSNLDNVIAAIQSTAKKQAEQEVQAE